MALARPRLAPSTDFGNAKSTLRWPRLQDGLVAEAKAAQTWHEVVAAA